MRRLIRALRNLTSTSHYSPPSQQDGMRTYWPCLQTPTCCVTCDQFVVPPSSENLEGVGHLAHRCVFLATPNTRPLQSIDWHCGGLSIYQVRSHNSQAQPLHGFHDEAYHYCSGDFYEPRTKHASPSDLSRRFTPHYAQKAYLVQYANKHEGMADTPTHCAKAYGLGA